jgi:AcrR family transcriptional regulator
VIATPDHTETSRRTQRERREDTRRRLIEATISAIAADGYRAATTRRVAELAGVSLGALAHHFPSREGLIATTIDDVGQRVACDLRGRLGAIDPDDGRRTRKLLDVLWSYFDGELFGVWLKVWLAAAEDPALYARLAPIDRDLNTAVSAAVADLAPDGVAQRAWAQRVGVALSAMRGLALALNIEPHEPRRADPWPATRRELAHLLDR